MSTTSTKRTFLVKQVSRRAIVHASYPDLDEALRVCMAYTMANEGSETSWWVLQTDREIQLTQDVQPMLE